MTTLLIDGNNLVMTAIFAMRRSNLSAHGVLTGPLMVSINRIARFIREEEPNHVLVCWDGGKSAWRTELDAGYKAGRTPMVDNEHRLRDDTFYLVQTFCDLAGIPTLMVPGQEADDLIASAWRASTDDKIVIVSADKDLMQLLGTSPRGAIVEQVRLGSANGHGKTDIDRWTAERFIAERGFRPEQLPLVMALTGDTVDGVRGVPGIGPKKALKLLQDNQWDMDRVIASVGDLKGAEAAARIPSDLRLVDLQDVDLYDIETEPWLPVDGDQMTAWSSLMTFLRHYELVEIQRQLYQGRLWTQTGSSARVWGAKATS